MAPRADGRAFSRRDSIGGQGVPYEALDMLQDDDPQHDSETPLSEGGGTDIDPLLSDVRRRDPFRRRRWRCIARPDTAAETLGPWARLELTITGARELVEEGNNFISTLDPKVKVFLDDIFAYETHTQSRTACPRWEHSGFLNVTAPRSMVRLQVVNAARKNAGSGFVEFCLGDVPFDIPVEGWLELRFQQNLQRTSAQRYRMHCRERQDSISQRDGHLVFREGTYLQTQTSRPKDPFKLYCKPCTAKPLESDSNDADIHNAGELLVKMRLRRLGSRLDSLVAMALDPPRPHNFGTFEQLDALPELDPQVLCDDTMQFKMAVLDDCLLCVWNYINYIVRWRAPLVSFTLTAIFAATCIYTWLTLATFPAVLATMLLLNASQRVRTETTTAGSNAPLTQEGFLRVASLESVGQMRTYLERIVAELGGHTDGAEGAEKMGLLAVRCVRDGVPLVPLQELRSKLRRATWISFADVAFTAGDLVFIDKRYCATVRAIRGDLVTVEYDGAHTSAVRQMQEDVPGGTDTVDIKRVTMRPVMRKVPGYLIPRAVDSYVRMYKHQLENFYGAWYPKVKFIEGVLTWRSRKIASCLVVVCYSVSAGGFSMWYHRDRVDETSMPIAHAIKTALMWSDNAIVLMLGLVVLVSQAPWFIVMRSFGRILVTSVCGKRRSAPKCWAFFRPVGSDL